MRELKGNALGIWLFALSFAPPMVVSGQATRVIETPDVRSVREGAPAVDTIWRIGQRPDERRETTFGMIVAVAVDSAAHILVVDIREPAVRVLSKDGRYIRTLGAKGDGPGEFRMPINVSVAREGSIFVNDMARGVVVEFDRNLRHVRDIRLSRRIADPVNLVVTDQFLFVSGVTRSDSLARNHVIHAFKRADGAYVKSFGQLAPAPTSDVARALGAGQLSPGSGNTLWYVQRAPYVIRRYAEDGRLLLEIVRATSMVRRADDMIQITAEKSKVSVERKAYPAACCIRELAAGGLVTNINVLTPGAFVTDVFDATYSLHRSWIGLPPSLVPLGDDLYVSVEPDNGSVPSVAVVRVRGLAR